MTKRILTFILFVTLLTSCGSDNDSFSNGGANINNGSNNSTTIATPGMSKPVNPIPESEWAGNWNDKDNPNYPGVNYRYNPLQGEWILTAVNNKSTDQFLVYQILYSVDCATLLTKPAEGKEPEYKNYQKLQINNTQIKDERGYIYNYALASDRSWMTLYDGTNTYTFAVYDNNGIWHWKGDWNDIRSPYYSVYQGKYNPVEGIWKEVSNKFSNNIEDSYYKFYDDCYIGASKTFYGSFPIVGKYEINDDGIRELQNGITSSSLNKYKIEGYTMYLYPYIYSGGKYVLYDSSTTKLVRVK